MGEYAKCQNLCDKNKGILDINKLLMNYIKWKWIKIFDWCMEIGGGKIEKMMIWFWFKE